MPENWGRHYFENILAISKLITESLRTSSLGFKSLLFCIDIKSYVHMQKVIPILSSVHSRAYGLFLTSCVGINLGDIPRGLRHPLDVPSVDPSTLSWKTLYELAFLSSIVTLQNAAFLSFSVQLHRAREVPEDGDAAVLLGGGDARQEPRGARVDGEDAHQGQEVLQRLQEEDGGRHGHLLRRSVIEVISRSLRGHLAAIWLQSTVIFWG